jgi:predicted nucleotidyltransferase
MTKSDVIEKLESLKPRLKEEGFEVVGLFGSFARGDFSDSSDVDILYTLINPHEFVEKNGGFGAFTKIRETKEFLSDAFGRGVDFVDKSSLSRTGKKYILGDLLHV